MTQEPNLRQCNWGPCLVEQNPDGTDSIWMGPVGCPCDNLPSWRKHHLEQMHKPSLPVKARGRHGSRVQRSKHRKQHVVRLEGGAFLMDWMVRLQQKWAQEDAEDYPAVRDEAFEALPLYTVDETIEHLRSDDE